MSHTIKLNEDLGMIVLRAKGSMNVTEITEALDELVLSGVFIAPYWALKLQTL
jgi:hypothetical protein